MATKHYTTKIIEFPDSGDTVVVTYLPDDRWHAYRPAIDEGEYKGCGVTILEAIADLVENIKGE